jgi:hypothetical protein
LGIRGWLDPEIQAGKEDEKKASRVIGETAWMTFDLFSKVRSTFPDADNNGLLLRTMASTDRGSQHDTFTQIRPFLTEKSGTVVFFSPNAFA